MRDALYVALDKWDDFLHEPDNRRFQSDLFEQLVNIESDLKRIAVPEALLRSEITTLSEMFQNFFNLKVLFIIVNAQPDLQPVDNDMKVQRRWKFESTQGGAFFWNNDRGSLAFGDSKYIGYKALYRLIEEPNKRLGKGLTTNLIRSFEIRPIFVVRRWTGLAIVRPEQHRLKQDGLKQDGLKRDERERDGHKQDGQIDHEENGREWHRLGKSEEASLLS